MDAVLPLLPSTLQRRKGVMVVLAWLYHLFPKANLMFALKTVMVAVSAPSLKAQKLHQNFQRESEVMKDLSSTSLESQDPGEQRVAARRAVRLTNDFASSFKEGRQLSVLYVLRQFHCTLRAQRDRDKYSKTIRSF